MTAPKSRIKATHQRWQYTLQDSMKKKCNPVIGYWFSDEKDKKHNKFIEEWDGNFNSIQFLWVVILKVNPPFCISLKFHTGCQIFILFNFF